MQHVSPQTELFEQPVAVTLAKHPRPFRVFGVRRARNPNGLRGLFNYAIAEWELAGKWLRVRDLVQQMRLANAVASMHELGLNRENYANVDGDQMGDVTPFEFRIVYHTSTGKSRISYPASPESDWIDALARELDELVHAGHATGGHIEEFVDGLGWVYETPQEADA